MLIILKAHRVLSLEVSVSGYFPYRRRKLLLLRTTTSLYTTNIIQFLSRINSYFFSIIVYVYMIKRMRRALSPPRSNFNSPFTNRFKFFFKFFMVNTNSPSSIIGYLIYSINVPTAMASV